MCMYFVQGLVNELVAEDRVSVVPPIRKFEVNSNANLMKELQPCDIVLYRFCGKKDFLGGVITHITSSPYSHAEVHISDGYDISAASHGVTFTDLYENVMFKGHHVDIFRLNRELTREERIIITGKALQSLCMPYDYINLISLPFVSKKQAIRLAGNHAYMCSENVAWAYNNAGIDLIKGTPESIEAPSDLGRSSILNYVGTFADGIKLEGDYRNKFVNQEWSVWSRVVAGAMGLFTNKDEYYKGLATNKTLLEGQA